jgi:hypothetical protein
MRRRRAPWRSLDAGLRDLVRISPPNPSRIIRFLTNGVIFLTLQ